MERRLRLVVFPLVALFVALPAVAEANEITSPESWFALAILMIVMMAVTALSGGYVLLREVKGQKHKFLTSIIAGALAMFLAACGQNGLVLVFIVIAVSAFWRSAHLINFAYKADPQSENPHLARAKPGRLLAAGLFLLCCLVFTFYTLSATQDAAAYVRNDARVQGQVEKFLAHQLALAEKNRRESGTARSVLQDDEGNAERLNDDGQRMFSGALLDENQWELKFESNEDLSTFTIFMTPKEFLGFPFNYIDTRPAFYADQTGVLRKIDVSEYRLCPPDAPAVPMRVLDTTPAPTE
ncbi:MAG TPA: hypothetical protein PKW95_15420 [bacterium]|nr:hypothetical protein [bacterium]